MMSIWSIFFNLTEFMCPQREKRCLGVFYRLNNLIYQYFIIILFIMWRLIGGNYNTASKGSTLLRPAA
jgi:hypothetical protein